MRARCLAGVVCGGVLSGAALCHAEPVRFDLRSVQSGAWSDPATWGGRLPLGGERVQVRAGHLVSYDVNEATPLRMVHIAGLLTFSREKDTQLTVGLLKIEPGDETSEDGFTCHDASPPPRPGAAMPGLEIGTSDHPLPAGVTATIRLKFFDGMDRETLPALIACGGRWDVHGAPMSRTWVKLGGAVNTGDSTITLAEPVTGWRVGDQVILTTSRQNPSVSSFRPKPGAQPPGGTEARRIIGMDGTVIRLDSPLAHKHYGDAGGILRSEVANLSRNVVIESADPSGVRGHTMYHCDSAGSISHAEFRHLGKEGVLGKYAIHFHLVRDTMRGSGVTGASIWDSHNRWITVHGSDHLVIRDCVGYQSVGHGFFLEDGTEQYNLLDRNLAVQAFEGKPLPQQALPFDQNEGAGFWWANGRNSFTRNVSCENDRYGYRFEIGNSSTTRYVLNLRSRDDEAPPTDIRTLPFLRFEDNESHSEGLYSFSFGDDTNGFVRGDRRHPFVARNLRAWETHYVLRPNLQFFLMEGLAVKNAVYGIYHPDFDAHVYRDILLDNVVSEPFNRGHDDESIQFGDFTCERLTLANCRTGRDPLIQMACTSPKPGVSGHFRELKVENSRSSEAEVVDLGGGPRNEKLEHPVTYVFHGYPGAGRTTQVVSARFPDTLREGSFEPVGRFTGPDVRAADTNPVPFPQLLEPVDDLPPATMATTLTRHASGWHVRGVSHDNGTVAAVMVNGRAATIASQNSGVADWEISVLEPPRDAWAVDAAGNTESWRHVLTSARPGAADAPDSASLPHWPQFRGPGARGIAEDASPPSEFGMDKGVAWKAPVPPGISSPIVWGERIFLTGIVDAKPAILCLNRSDGKLLWQRSVPAQTLESVHETSNPASATPVTDGRRVIGWFPTFGLMAWDFEGSEVWRKPMDTPFVVNGSGTSPMLAGGKLILCCDQQGGKSFLLAANPATGTTLWQTPRPQAVSGYTTPVQWRRESGDELVIVGSLRVTGYSLTDGKEHWTVGGLEAVSVCPTPVVGDGQLYVMSRSFGGSALPAGMEAMMVLADKDTNGKLTREEAPFLLKDGAFDFIDGDRDDSVTMEEFKAAAEHLRRAEFGLFAVRDPGVATGDLTATHVAWKHQKGIAKVTSPLLYRDRLWVIADGGLLTCTEATTGRILFERERLGGDAGGEYFASPVAADGRVFLCSARGAVTVVEATDALKILFQTKLDAPIQATPALAGDRFYVRTAKDLFAFGK